MPSSEPRRYKHITWRSDVGRYKQSGWVVQWKQRTWGGYHATQSQAAATLKKAMGLSAGESLDTHSAVQRGVLAQRHRGLYRRNFHRSIQDTICCCKGRWCGEEGLEAHHHPQWGQAYELIYCGILPADADDMHQRAPVLAKLILEEPSLELVILQLKYGPWRSAVVNAWQQWKSNV